ncbi:Glutaredoxin-C6 [Triticum urartu]|uniref:Glutaredoxin-C6 n=1 Tax=Triticum urartu TaxID=4572 RepID=M7YPB1_TRIUA|nr:Glutaredoxin-C6 [Triticum urartu]
MALAKAKEIVASAPVVVFSKSYCPFCVQVKKLLTQLGASFKAIEMDTERLGRNLIQLTHVIFYEGDGTEIQSALAEWTGQRTVPNVFINGKHIGGCDDTIALNKGGKLVALLTEAGAISGSSSKTTVTA